MSIRHMSNRGNQMEFIILGLLLLKPMSGYEIGKFIKENFSLICSSSPGSVQAAIKKIVANGSVHFDACLDNGKNKKIFSITEKGKEEFYAWVRTPMQIEKVKNMELSKLFFLGFAQKSEQIAVIEAYIAQLEKAKATLIAIRQQFDQSKEAVQSIIAEFNEYTLHYGIDSATFEIKWYTELMHKLKE